MSFIVQFIYRFTVICYQLLFGLFPWFVSLQSLKGAMPPDLSLRLHCQCPNWCRYQKWLYAAWMTFRGHWVHSVSSSYQQRIFCGFILQIFSLLVDLSVTLEFTLSAISVFSLCESPALKKFGIVCNFCVSLLLHGIFFRSDEHFLWLTVILFIFLTVNILAYNLLSNIVYRFISCRHVSVVKMAHCRHKWYYLIAINSTSGLPMPTYFWLLLVLHATTSSVVHLFLIVSCFRSRRSVNFDRVAVQCLDYKAVCLVVAVCYHEFKRSVCGTHSWFLLPKILQRIAYVRGSVKAFRRYCACCVWWVVYVT